jgi:tetratricopeptide (TPR) repeat protein
MENPVCAEEQMDRRRLPEAFALIAACVPCLILAANRGGMAIESQSWAYAVAFAGLGTWGAMQWRAGRRVRVPWLSLFIVGWPLLQVAPAPRAVLAQAAPERTAELARFAAAGIAVPPTISIYPYATARAFLMLAGSVALFLFTSDFCRRRPAGPDWMAAAVLIMGLAEALPALRQHLMLRTGLSPAAMPGGDFAHGTFGNRNLLAAWLEGAYGLALGVIAGGLRCRQREAHWSRLLLAAFTALASAVAIVCSFSRMGTAMLALETLGLAALCVRRRRAALSGLAMVGAAAVCVSAIGAPGIAVRYTGVSLKLEKEGRLAMWMDAMRATRRYPVLGAGAGAFPFAFRRSHPYFTGYTIDHPHNEYLETAVEWGIPAALLLMAGTGALALRCLLGLRRACGERKWPAVGCLAGACAILLHAAVDFPLRIPAILALASVLLGMAAAGALPMVPAVPSGARAGGGALRHAGNALFVLACLGLTAVCLWALPPAGGRPVRLEGWNAGTHYRLGRDLDAAAGPDAEAACRRTLRLCPYAAAAWCELARIAAARGERAEALRCVELARMLEPHTRRVQWAAANLLIQMGEPAAALPLFDSLVSHTPELRRAVWEVSWNAGMPGGRILDRLTGKFPDDLEDYLRYLLDRGRWGAEVEACARAAAAGRRPPVRILREAFDRMFQAGRFPEMLRLWRIVAPGETAEFSNGNLAAPLRGYGLDWVVQPAGGVAVERRAERGCFRLDVEFLRPQNIGYSGVIHDFAVTPGRRYALRFEAAAQEITSSSGVEIDVISLRRRLAASENFRRSAGWKTVELRFQPRQDEPICRMRIVRPPCPSFDNQITGRFSLRHVSLVALDRARAGAKERHLCSPPHCGRGPGS